MGRRIAFVLTMAVALGLTGGIAGTAVLNPVLCPTGPDNECRGTNGEDAISGSPEADVIYALRGADTVTGGTGQD